MTNKLFKNFIIFLLLVVFSTNIIIADPDSEWINRDPDRIKKERSKNEKKIQEEIESSGYGGSFDNLAKKTVNGEYISEKDGSLKWYLQYIIFPGNYIENVDSGIWVGNEEKEDRTVVKDYSNGKTVCFHDDEPQNLLNHNCDIPALGSELFQNSFKDSSKTGLQNGKVTSARSSLGIGVPLGVKNVPVKPEDRKEDYTFLEIFGYDLPYTNYYGEWDYIQVNSEARLLSNVGFFGKAKLVGATIWNSLTGGFATIWNNWVFSPIKWGKKSPGFVGGALGTYMDTADLYTVANQYWKRPNFDGTLYHAYYMSDREIISKAMTDFLLFFKENLFEMAEKHPRIKTVFYLMQGGKDWPVFVYDPNVCKKESCSKDNSSGNSSGQGVQSKVEKITIPLDQYFKEHVADTSDGGREVSCECIEYETEEEQFEKWKKLKYQVDYDTLAKTKGIDCFSGSQSYEALSECWIEPWTRYARKESNHDLPLMQMIMQEVENKFFGENPKYDISKQIGHYICADEEGNPIGEDSSDWEYIYEKENSREKEFLNPNCKPVRPSVKGSLYGNGENDTSDTRYLQFKNSQKRQLAFKSDFISDITSYFSRVNTKLTNLIISFSFSNFIEFLHLDVLLIKIIGQFKNSVYLPLAQIFIILSGLFIFFQFFKGRAFHRLVKLTIIFIFGVALLSVPDLLFKFVEYIPSEIDKTVLGVVLGETSSKDICGATGENSEIRSFQCEIWRIGVFQPYLYGQWGTNKIEDLNTENFKNKNQDLVGEAFVDLGNNKTFHNWAIWQLDKIKSGTITTDDENVKEFITPKSLYKLVDLQYGPLNGKDSDDRFARYWSGIEGHRGAINLLSFLVTLAVLIVIGGLGYFKLETTLELFIKILMLPYILVTSLLPNRETEIKKHLLSISDVFLKRFFIVIFMSVSMKILVNILNSTESYFLLAFICIIILVVIKIYYIELINKLSVNDKENELGKASQKYQMKNLLPTSLRMELDMETSGLSQSIAGAVGAGVASTMQTIKNRKNGIRRTDGKSDIIESIKKGFNSGGKRGENLVYKRQRRLGLGILTQMKTIENSTKDNILRDMRNPKSEYNTLLNYNLESINKELSFGIQKANEIRNKIDTTEDINEVANLKLELGILENRNYEYEFARNKINQILESESQFYNLEENSKYQNTIYSKIRQQKRIFNIEDEAIRDKAYRGSVDSLVSNLINIRDDKTEERIKKGKKYSKTFCGKTTKTFDNIKNKVSETWKEDKEILHETKDMLIEDVNENFNKIIDKGKNIIKEALPIDKMKDLVENDYQKDLKEYYNSLEEYSDYNLGNFDDSTINKVISEIESEDPIINSYKDVLKVHAEFLQANTSGKTQDKSIYEQKGEYGYIDKNARGKAIEKNILESGNEDIPNLLKPQKENYDFLGRKLKENSNKIEKKKKSYIDKLPDLLGEKKANKSEKAKRNLFQKLQEYENKRQDFINSFIDNEQREENNNES